MLRCRSVSGVSEWYHTPIGGRIYRIAQVSPAGLGCTVQNQFSSVYSVISNDGGRRHCDLVINSADSSLTGRYTCLGNDGHASAANVTTIGQLFNMFFSVYCTCRLQKVSLVSLA